MGTTNEANATPLGGTRGALPPLDSVKPTTAHYDPAKDAVKTEGAQYYVARRRRYVRPRRVVVRQPIHRRRVVVRRRPVYRRRRYF